MKDLLTVLTCPRGKNYLPDTLASLDRGGARSIDRFVLVDGRAQGFSRPGWSVDTVNHTPQGSLHALFATLRWARNHDVDRLLYFEDDVVVCKNAIPRMLAVGVPENLAFVSFFDMKEMSYAAPPGMYEMSPMGNDGRGFWGMQSVLLPRRTIEFILRNEDRIRRFGNKQSGETLFGYELLKDGQKYGVHVPNLVEHVGDVSAIWSWTPSVNRRSTSFPGESFDAASL